MTANVKDLPAKIVTFSMIDETSDLGSRVHGKYYVMSATVIDIDRQHDFAEITRSYGFKEEMKFNSHRKQRFPITAEISDFKPRIYSISVTKPAKRKWDRKEQNNVHARMLYKLMLFLTKKEKTSDFDITVDENDRISKTKVMKIAAQVSKKRKKTLKTEVRISADDHRLQTNDYIIGSIGKMHNREDMRFIERIGAMPCNRRLIFFKTKELPFIKGQLNE